MLGQGLVSRLFNDLRCRDNECRPPCKVLRGFTYSVLGTTNTSLVTGNSAVFEYKACS